jgi:hypothetical protein
MAYFPSHGVMYELIFKPLIWAITNNRTRVCTLKTGPALFRGVRKGNLNRPLGNYLAVGEQQNTQMRGFSGKKPRTILAKTLCDWWN